jgi:hypothetical protein
MRPIDRRGRLRASLICTALALCLALPGAASAATPGGGTAQVSVGKSVPVLAKVVAIVDVSFTCDPFLIFDMETGMMVESTAGHLVFGGVTLTQAAGKSINVAGADLPEGTPEANVVCDGVTLQTRSVAVRAVTQPWKSGAAVVSARVQVFDELGQSRDIGQSGPVVVKLGK